MSVQIRKTPTLKELLEESEIRKKFLHPQNSNKVSHSDVFVGTMDSLSPASAVFPPPKTSTTYSACFSSKVSSYEGCLNDQHDSQQESQPCSFNGESHLSPSSGYVTYENPENISISEWTESRPERHDFSSSEEIGNKDGFFLHNISNTIAKMPDIINHPPIDGEELERGELESVFLEVKDICDISFQNDSLACDRRNTEQIELSHLENVELEEYIPFAAKLDHSNHVNTEINEGLLTLSDKTGFSGDLDLSQTLINPHCLTPEPQKNSSKADPVDDHINTYSTKQSEELHPLSLQALLKKSQEYRRRQRMLRNQAKNTKIQEKTQEQPKQEEQSLSDKENEDKGTRTAEDKNIKEHRGNFIPPVEKNTIESEACGERANVRKECVTQDGNATELLSVEEETTLKNKMNNFQEFITQSKQSRSLIQQQPTSAEKYQETINAIPCLKGSHKGVRKNRPVPAPTFCRSPVRCKSKDGPKDEPSVAEKKTSTENSDVNEGKAVPSSVNVTIGDDVTSVFARSSLHIDQLESNLSSLKELISDLESTVKENLDSQTESNVLSESGLKGVKRSEPIKQDLLGQRGGFGCLEDEQACGDVGDDNADGRGFQRQKLIDFNNIHEVSESVLSFNGTDGVCLTVQERAPEMVKLKQDKLCITAATERDKGKSKCAKGFVWSGASTRQPFPAKCRTSVAQRMLVPDIFRNVPTEDVRSCDTSVLSNPSNRPELMRCEVTSEGQGSVCSPSLNQSYDVEMPSGLWLLEGSGYDLGSQSHLGQEKNLTPESGGEEQGGVSKVKRRLLMHVTEGTQEISADVRGAASSAVRPNSSTPRSKRAQGSSRLLKVFLLSVLVSSFKFESVCSELMCLHDYILLFFTVFFKPLLRF